MYEVRCLITNGAMFDRLFLLGELPPRFRIQLPPSPIWFHIAIVLLGSAGAWPSVACRTPTAHLPSMQIMHRGIPHVRAQSPHPPYNNRTFILRFLFLCVSLLFKKRQNSFVSFPSFPSTIVLTLHTSEPTIEAKLRLWKVHLRTQSQRNLHGVWSRLHFYSGIQIENDADWARRTAAAWQTCLRKGSSKSQPELICILFLLVSAPAALTV